ncbi:MAG TPA: SRPBCC family protein [Solirubrobacteraceae bacterium]
MDLGTVEQRDGKQVIRFERHLRHPIERVWEALTDPDELIGWWGRVERELRVGGAFTVTWLNTRDHEGNEIPEPFTMDATITALQPPTLLEMDSEEHGVLRFDLVGTHDGTFLRFSATGDVPEEFRLPALAGWHMHLDALATVLDGGSVDLVEIPQWDEIRARY